MEELRERFGPRDVEEQPGCAPFLALLALAAVGGVLVGFCCLGVLLAWWPWGV